MAGNRLVREGEETHCVTAGAGGGGGEGGRVQVLTGSSRAGKGERPDSQALGPRTRRLLGPVSPLFQPLAAWETPIFAQGSGQAVSFPLLGGGPFAGLDQGPTLPTSVTRRVHPRADWYPGVGEGSAGTQAPWVYTPAPPPISGRPPTAYLHLPQSPCREMKTTEPRSTPHI